MRLRSVLAAGFIAVAALAAAPAGAENWPARPVRIIVGFSPGGSADHFGRLIAQELSETLGQQFFIEYHPGSSGIIAAGLTARAAPDGYTFMIGGSGPHITSPVINPNIGYDPLNDFTHVAMIGADSFVLIGSPSFGASDLAGVVTRGRAAKNPLTFSSPGPASLGDLMMEEFKRHTGIEMVHVPAPNSGLLDVMGSHIDMSITGLLTAGAQIRAGKVLPIGVTSTERNPVYKDIPTFAEQGFDDIHGDTWFWLTAPKALPPTITETLNREVRRILKTERVRAYFEREAAIAMDADVAELNRFLAGEIAYWGGLAKSVGLTIQ